MHGRGRCTDARGSTTGRLMRTPWSSARCEVIAEAGINHGGDEGMAHALVDAAADAGADAVKFQTYVPELTALPGAPLAAYQRGRLEGDMLDLARRHCLELDAWPRLAAHAADRGIVFCSTAFDLPSLELIVALGVDRLKVPSGEIVNAPLVRAAARTGLPAMVSTGMSTLAEVRRAIDWWDVEDGAEIAVLHCTSAYPTPASEANLRAMLTLAIETGRPVGLSDHTLGRAAACTAVAMGACIVEKHLTLDHGLPGPDHESSATPDELAALVAGVREVETLLGSARKEPGATELGVRPVARRSLRFARDLAAGHVLREEDLVALRPGTGVGVEHTDDLVGRELDGAVRAGDAVPETLLRDVVRTP